MTGHGWLKAVGEFLKEHRWGCKIGLKDWAMYNWNQLMTCPCSQIITSCLSAQSHRSSYTSDGSFLMRLYCSHLCEALDSPLKTMPNSSFPYQARKNSAWPSFSPFANLSNRALDLFTRGHTQLFLGHFLPPQVRTDLCCCYTTLYN